jgi:hypothetical protein
MSSQRNNDVAYYALVAKQFLQSGLQENFQVMNLNQNSAVLTQHQGVNQLIAFVTTMLNLKTFEVMNIIMWLILLITIYLLIEVIRTLNREVNIYLAAVIAGMVVGAPVMTYIYANYFLGQATAFIVELGFFLIFLEILRDRELSRRNLQHLAVLIALCVYLYPVFLIPLALMMVSIMYFLLYLDKRSTKKMDYPLFSRNLFLSFLIGSIISAPYAPYAWDLMVLLKNGSYGWSIRPIDPLSVFIATSYIDFKVPSLALQILGWLLTILILFYLVRKNQIFSKNITILVSLIFLIIVIYVYLMGNGDWGSYKNWKMLTFFMPILLVVFFTSLGVNRNSFHRSLFITLVLVEFTAPFRSWGGVLLNEVPSNVLTRNQVQINTNETSTLSKIDSLNVSMPTWFETMAMASILNTKHIYLNSQSYLPVKRDNDSCTLKHREAGETVRFVVAGDYVIIGSLKSKC